MGEEFTICFFVKYSLNSSIHVYFQDYLSLAHVYVSTVAETYCCISLDLDTFSSLQTCCCVYCVLNLFITPFAIWFYYTYISSTPFFNILIKPYYYFFYPSSRLLSSFFRVHSLAMAG